MGTNKVFGAFGESLATEYLTECGYKVLERNFSCRTGEIDIIARNKEYIVFIEVKARANLNYGLPCEAVNYHKQNVIGKVAAAYLANKKIVDENCRFDVIEVLACGDRVTNINHIIDAFQPRI